MRIKSLKDIIVQEDDHLIFVNKPAGLTSLHDRFGNAPSLIEFAKKYHETAQLCHRLDKDTSGILVIAKDNDTYKALAALFEKRLITKNYLAISHGRQYFENVVVELPIYTTSKGKAKVDNRRGKASKTTFNLVEAFKHYSLIQCQPESGRLHQIRVHLSSMRAPIAADTLYGGKLPYASEIIYKYSKGRDKDPRPIINRLALHAFKLEFDLNNHHYIVEAPLGKDLNVFLKLLRKNDSI